MAYGRKCQICSSMRIHMLNNKLYCESCDVYYYLRNGVQVVATLPVNANSQPFLDLCPRCSELSAKTKRKIKCKTFRGYFARIGYCSVCKNLNRDLFKNLFYKNFLLHQKDQASFGPILKLALFLLSFLFMDKKYVMLGILLYIQRRSGNLTIMRALFSCFLVYRYWWSLSVKLLLISCGLYMIFNSYSIQFYVPENLYCPEDLSKFIGNLNFSTGEEYKKSTRKFSWE
ncbi:hypothetical protein ENBRE01_2508 [Enteropsectra breve]|nr:hypothetical protein ENBRE01_2508 [Enteropsectra breve]